MAVFVPLRHCYTQREATPTQKSARKGRCDLLLPLARKITKGIHSRKPSSLNRPTVDEAGSCCLLITLSDGLRCKVLGDEFFSQLMDSMLLQEIFQRPFSSNNDNKKKRKEKPTGQWRARNTHVTQIVSYRIFKRMVPIDYSYQPKKEYQEPSLFTCPVTALSVFNRRRLTLCTALSTSPPGHPGSPAATCIYIFGLLPIELSILFYFGPPKINGC